MNRAAGFAVGHVAEEMAVVAGGVPAVVRQLTDRLTVEHVPVSVLHANGDAQDLAAMASVTKVAPAGVGRVLAYSPALRPALRALVRQLHAANGLVHVHGVWSAPQLMACVEAKAAGVPSLLTVHGMLEPWLWEQQGIAVRLKKSVFWAAMARPRLSQVSVVHAITPLERDHLARLLPGNRIEVIPNAIDMPPTSQPATPMRSIVFLGRIEPKKGVDLLIKAFAAAALSADWRLDIVGPSWSDKYLAQLKAITVTLGLQQRVTFHGALFGKAKTDLLEAAWVMAAPSHSEVVGLVNLEAAARHVPSITTHQTGLFDWQDGGGLLIEPEVDALAGALKAACSWTDEERRHRGAASWQLVHKRYSWPAVMPQWIRLYEDLTH